MYAYEYLEAAKARIIKYGWVKRRFGNEDVGYCAMGAIRASCQDANVISHATTALFIDAINGELVENRGIPSWNDNPNRTLEQVLGKFDKAIAKAKGYKKHLSASEGKNYVAKVVPELIEV